MTMIIINGIKEGYFLRHREFDLIRVSPLNQRDRRAPLFNLYNSFFQEANNVSCKIN